MRTFANLAQARRQVVVTVIVAVGIASVFLAPIVVSAVPAVPAWRAERPWSTERAIVTVGDASVVAEIADTPALRSRGLGYRDSLEPESGMIFIFDGLSTRSFWMKGMRFCIDIVWIQDDEVIGIEPEICPSPGVEDADLPRVKSPEPVDFVLEVPAGWMEANGGEVGSPVSVEFGA